MIQVLPAFAWTRVDRRQSERQRGECDAVLKAARGQELGDVAHDSIFEIHRKGTENLVALRTGLAIRIVLCLSNSVDMLEWKTRE